MRPSVARTVYTLQVMPRLPAAIGRLAELAEDLWYAWHRPARELYSRLHPALWEAVGHNPKAFLHRVDQRRLDDAAQSDDYAQAYKRVLASYDAYMEDSRPRLSPPAAPVAYFCAEFGLHESLPIYSGGLGILAGDHCKAASDLRFPLVAVGLLYRQGYFIQTIDAAGNQLAAYPDAEFAELPVSPVILNGEALRIQVELRERVVDAQVWQARVGHVRLYLLSTDTASNGTSGAGDRTITHRLYGGDRRLRLEQELVLGVGGARALAAMGIRPSAWHINEGHAALLILERTRALVADGLPLAAAREAVAANTVFTTHTPVPAGHDHFPPEMAGAYFDACCRGSLAREDILAQGAMEGSPDFNLTAFGMRGARFQNGVSRLHGEVAAKMLQPVWPQVPPAENPVGHVTNGVHVPTFLAPDWADAFERYVGIDWRERLATPEGARRVAEIPDEVFWSVHQRLKTQMLRLVRRRVRARHLALGGSEAHAERILRHADPEDPAVLTIGFSRRFATYKRADLLFRDLQRLQRIAADALRPVVFIFAGKAHPADEPGQQLIRELARISRMPGFEDRVLLVEGYDLNIARRLVSGVDLWLNTPIHTTEASGTSGMKAAINGVLNLSVLDGWWAEGYARGAGWAIRPASAQLGADERDAEEAAALYDLLEDEIVPLYYTRERGGWAWLKMAKASMAQYLPAYDAARMVRDYAKQYYGPAAAQGAIYSAEGGSTATAVAAWKRKVTDAWGGILLRRVDTAARKAGFGDKIRIEVDVALAGLDAGDVAVELVLSAPAYHPAAQTPATYRFEAVGAENGGSQRYALEIAPELCGRLVYSIRAYPTHERLSHRFETGLMSWL
jgi:starch phosphorylase